jgi:uncharacterized protein YdbL (DUF1318 family)
MSISRRRLRAATLSAFLGVALLAAAAAPAAAQDAASLKAQGVIGEKPDGLLGFVQGQVTPDVRSAVERINAQRKQQYEQVAKSTGRALPEVQAVAGEKLMGATPSGQYVMSPGGGWTKK